MGNSVICKSTNPNSPRIIVDINNQVKEYEQKIPNFLMTSKQTATIPQPIQIPPNNNNNISNTNEHSPLSSEEGSTQLIQNYEYVEFDLIDLSTIEEIKEDEEPIAESSLPIPIAFNSTINHIHMNNSNNTNNHNNHNNSNDKIILNYPTLEKIFPNIKHPSSEVILFQSNLLKLINLQYRSTKTYTDRYCFVNRQSFVMFNSKESFLRSKAPLGFLPINEIIKVMKFKMEEHNKKYNHFYISFKRTVLTEKFYSYINKHFFKNDQSEALIMFKCDDVNIIHNWFLILNYLICTKNTISNKPKHN